MAEFDQAERERRLRADIESKFGEVLASARNLQVAEELLDLNRKVPRPDPDARRPRCGNSTARCEPAARGSEPDRCAPSADLEAKLGVSVLELKSLVGMRPDEGLARQRFAGG